MYIHTWTKNQEPLENLESTLGSAMKRHISFEWIIIKFLGSHFVPLEQPHQTQHQLHKTAEIITKRHIIRCT